MGSDVDAVTNMLLLFQYHVQQKQSGELPSVLLWSYGDSVDNTVEQNSTIFSLMQMHWLPSARACGQ